MKDLAINRYLDAAILSPELPQAEMRSGLEACLAYEVKSVCMRPCDVELAIQVCRNTRTDVGCVLNFPHGVGLTAVKAYEAERYIDLGVREIDMVVNYGYCRSGEWALVEQDIASVSRVTQPAGVVLKVILETGLLSLDEIGQATRIAAEARADFVKTSTGFSGGGATVEAVECMLRAAGGRIQVKASGGIRDYERARLFVELGCQRLGVSYTSLPAICDPASVSERPASGY